VKVQAENGLGVDSFDFDVAIDVVEDRFGDLKIALIVARFFVEGDQEDRADIEGRVLAVRGPLKLNLAIWVFV